MQIKCCNTYVDPSFVKHICNTLGVGKQGCSESMCMLEDGNSVVTQRRGSRLTYPCLAIQMPYLAEQPQPPASRQTGRHKEQSTAAATEKLR